MVCPVGLSHEQSTVSIGTPWGDAEAGHEKLRQRVHGVLLPEHCLVRYRSLKSEMGLNRAEVVLTQLTILVYDRSLVSYALPSHA
jgi:hypothetical protein